MSGKREVDRQLDARDGLVTELVVTPDGASYAYSMLIDLCDLYLVDGLR